MGMTSFYMGSLRYSPCGRKRKNHAANRVKKKPVKFTEALKPSENQLNQLRSQQAKQYKSLMEEAIKDGTFRTDAIENVSHHATLLATYRTRARSFERR